jgi:hypothetical protein
MANRNNTFLLKRSNIPNKIPNIGDLLLGEIALNTADSKLYTSYTGGLSGTTEIRQIGWDRLSTISGGTVNNDVNFFGDVSISGSSLPNGYALSVTGDTNFVGDVYVEGDLFYNGSVVITGSTIIEDGLSANTIYTDYIDFNQNYTGTTTQGRINWDTGTGTLNIGVGDSTTGLIDLQVGQEEVVRVYNAEATTLLKGEIVYVSGSQGNRPAVKRAQAQGDLYSVTTLGMVDRNISSGAEGYVTTFGIISNLNTLGLTGGTPIWLSPSVAGAYTSTKPKAPDHTVLIGYVVRVSTTVGSIFINISNGWELDELHDVRINGVTEGDLLMRSSYSGSPVWVNTKTLNGSYTITGNTTIGGNLVVSGNTGVNWFSSNTSTDLVRITQTGSGNALFIEDSTNPDSSPFVVDSSGNVGIGTGSPQYRLDILGTTGRLFYDGDTTRNTYRQSQIINQGPSTGITAISVASEGSGSQIELFSIGSGVLNSILWRFAGEPNDVALYASSAANNLNIMNNLGSGTTDNIRFYVGGSGHITGQTPSMIIIGSGSTRGYVGIGTTSPTEKLYVSGNTYVSGEITTDSVVTMPNFKYIQNKNDFPTAIGGIITLSGDTTYFINTTVDLTGDRLVAGQNTTILGGSSENSRLKSTGLSGTALLSSAWSIPMRGLTIESDVALNLDAGGNTNQAIDWFGINFTNCNTIGLIKDYSNIIWTDCAILESANLTFSGTIATIGFSTCLFNGISGKTIFNIPSGCSITRRFRPIYSSFIVLPGETGITISNSAIVNNDGFILDTINFAGGGTYISGLDSTSAKSLFSNNVGILNSSNIGHYYMINNTTNTIIGVPNVNVWVKAAGTTTLGVGNSPRWVVNGNNRLDYTGNTQQDFKFTAVGTVQSASVNQVISVGLAINGTIQTESEITVRTATSNQPYPFAIQDLAASLSAGAYIEVFVLNTQSPDIRVGDLNVIIDKISV